MPSPKENLRILTKEDLVERFRKTASFITDFFGEKTEDYDIKFYKEFGGFSLLLRIKEKEYRLNRLLLKEGEPKFESIDDSIKDLSTLYTALYSMLQFDLISVDKLKVIYAQVLEVDISEVVAKDDAKRIPKKKWFQFWKR